VTKVINMETRPLGETGQESSILTLGAIALDNLEQEGANQAVELAVSRGVNHVDVAPTYGDAELKLAPTLGEYREELFLGCKTQERTYEGARAELEASLDRLGVETIDLYQFHAVTTEEELETITGEGGALEAFREAKAEGLIDHVGLTSHGEPDLILEAIDRIDDLETVMFPLNYVVLGKGGDYDYRRVLERAREENLGTLGIKAFAKGPWPEEVPREKCPYATWYEPHDEPARLQECLNFALSQGLTSITNAGDPKLLAGIIAAAENYEELSDAEQASLMDRADRMDTPVPTQ
jgi:predicted aldo/keto reductase-like oxidoreductase